MSKDKNAEGLSKRGSGPEAGDVQKAGDKVKKTASFPGGAENAAGAGGKKSDHPNAIGSPPVNTDDLNTGEDRKK